MKFNQTNSTLRNIKDSLSFRFYLQYRKIYFHHNFTSSIYTQDNKPSLLINFDDRTFHCFSTNTHGDILKYHCDDLKLEVNQALTQLKEILTLQISSGFSFTAPDLSTINGCNANNIARSATIFRRFRAAYCRQGIPNYDLDRKAIVARERYYQARRIQVYKFIEKYSQASKYSIEIIDYLTGKNRKLKLGTIKKFRLIEIKNPAELAKRLKDKFSLSVLLISGVFNDKGNFMFFYHRLLIPYLNNNNIEYLRGRAFPDTTNNIKYLGPKNVTMKRIFNIDVLKTLRKGSRLLLCEGEFDTMIAIQSGYNAIGFPGVNGIDYDILIKYNLQQYKVFVAFDNDKAGKIIAQQIADNLKITVKQMNLRNCKDLTEVYNG